MSEFKERLGYIGVGSLGGGVARGLKNKGFDITVYDICPETMETFGNEGFKISQNLKEIVESTDILLTCVDGDYNLINLISAEGGILDYAHPGQIIIMQSTVKITVVKDMAKLAAEKGVGFVDAPANGNLQDRINGTMAVYVGAEETDYKRCEPILLAMTANGNKLRYFGEVGRGTAAGLINSNMNIIALAATWETMRTFRAYGGKEETLIDVAAKGSGNSYVTTSWPYHDDLLKSHRLGPGLCRILRNEIIDSHYEALKRGVAIPLAYTAGMVMENVFCERAEYLKKRDGFEYEPNQTVRLGLGID